MSSEPVVVAGVGMTPFSRPAEAARYEALGSRAVLRALADAGVDYSEVKQVCAGWVYGDSASGQCAVYGAGLTGLPIVNVNNNCSSGSTALYLARQAVMSGSADCVVALGFEEMPAGPIDLVFPERTSPLGHHLAVADQYLDKDDSGPMTLRAFAAAAREHMERDAISVKTYAKIAVKARRHAQFNEFAAYREPITVDDVLNSKSFISPLTKLQCCPPVSGAAAAVLCSKEYARARNLDGGVQILAQSMTTDKASSFGGSAIDMVGTDMSRRAALNVYESAGIGPTDVDVCELHDCFTINEALSYESLGFTPAGTAERFVENGGNTYGGRVVINPSGGLLSKGHPLGATGLAQCAELVEQLRNRAGKRQVPNARIGLQHNVGLGGAAVVTLYGQ